MSREFTKADAKAYACSYLLLTLLQRMDQREPGLIESLIAGAEGDFAACRLQEDLPPAVPLIHQETLALLNRANAYKLNMQDRAQRGEGE
ncbi:hypothetical protein [Dyella acidiphila]|uniref:Uncharacterized protein n=1 Tax=Dyella acidiphila TaxID=2775866 RepID=A0ABR9G4T1_9GAMM|nr:hypothetical protein [Dyella acidiphila]MBE1159063.1 hypothetical protein [Dyella acidiphila]